MGSCIALLLVAASDSSAQQKITQEQRSKKIFDEVINSYTLIGDFNEKRPTRPISDEIFEAYPLGRPQVQFEINPDEFDFTKDMPATKGSGRPTMHLNRGRVLYQKKLYNRAKAVFLSARARYGKDFKHHRRNDFYLGLTFMRLAEQVMAEPGRGYDDQEVKALYANASSFLSWAFVVKPDDGDELLARVAPRGLANLAAIYWRYERYSAAFGVASKGLDFLRRTGRKEKRPVFHQMMAEAHILNRTYLDAVQELDVALRQDPDPELASAIFSRIGDIYFDLKNYELAEDVYALGAKVDEEQRQINPAQVALRGESLFWLGRFSEAQKLLHFALQGSMMRRKLVPLPNGFAPYLALRIADGYLARKSCKPLDKKGKSSRKGCLERAKLEYFRVARDYRGTGASRIAKVRGACLELPEYQGNNVMHARATLESLKAAGNKLSPVMQEMAWSCEVASYAQRERTKSMVDRVRKFHDQYPESRFLAQLVQPVREVQASRIEDFLKAGSVYKAISYFEKNRQLLYQKMSPALKQRLFIAYTDANQSSEATQFWKDFRQARETDQSLIRAALVATESIDQGKERKKWLKESRALAKKLNGRQFTLKPSDRFAEYMRRILATTSKADHLPWIYELMTRWAKTSVDSLCNLQYPILSGMSDSGGWPRARIDKEVEKIFSQSMPQMLGANEPCGVSLLDLEAKTIGRDPQKLAQRYLQRRSWPLKGDWLQHVWTLSERLWDADRDTARRIASWVASDGPQQSSAVRFAKARLDPTRTEFEGLWGD